MRTRHRPRRQYGDVQIADPQSVLRAMEDKFKSEVADCLLADLPSSCALRRRNSGLLDMYLSSIACGLAEANTSIARRKNRIMAASTVADGPMWLAVALTWVISFHSPRVSYSYAGARFGCNSRCWDAGPVGIGSSLVGALKLISDMDPRSSIE